MDIEYQTVSWPIRMQRAPFVEDINNLGEKTFGVLVIRAFFAGTHVIIHVVEIHSIHIWVHLYIN